MTIILDYFKIAFMKSPSPGCIHFFQKIEIFTISYLLTLTLLLVENCHSSRIDVSKDNQHEIL